MTLSEGLKIRWEQSLEGSSPSSGIPLKSVAGDAFDSNLSCGVPFLSVTVMNQLFRFSSAVKRHPAIDAWIEEQSDELGAIAHRWFEVMRNCGDDVRELLHDGHPTACVVDAAFAYVNAFTSHVNVGFFHGAELADPEGLLEGDGKYMRHVKVRPDGELEVRALIRLIEAAYTDMRSRLEAE
jgi:hypothetical protein